MIKVTTIWSLVISVFCIISSCNSKETLNSQESEMENEQQEDVYYNVLGFPKYLNSVKGHKEEFEITGNFTGGGIDTLYVLSIEIDTIDNMSDRYKFFVKSNNPDLPEIEMYGCDYVSPGLVFEGDVDGDGKDEWGYLHTWLSSQWRQYRIYTYDNDTKKWRHLYYGELLDTPESLRASGLDIVEKGHKKGYIKINYYSQQDVIKDTIVVATYTPITENTK